MGAPPQVLEINGDDVTVLGSSWPSDSEEGMGAETADAAYW